MAVGLLGFDYGHAQSTYFTAERIDAIDAFISERMINDDIPGVSVVLVENGQVVRYLVKGITGKDQEPVTPQTIFALGSVSKSFTGLAILQLAEEGRLKLDDRVVRHLPWFRTLDPDRSNQITIRHLLHHISGLSSYDGNTLLADRRRSDDRLEMSVRRLANVALRTDPGTAFAYSNDNYRILGLLLQVVEGVSYEKVIERRIFQPLKMTASRFFGMGKPGVAIPHRYWLATPIPHQLPLGSSNNPETGVYASGEDMGAYIVSLTGGNATIPDFWRPALAEGPTLRNGLRYSVGFESHGSLDAPMLLHGGWNAGFMARIGLDPARRIGVVIMANAGRGYVAGDIDLLTKGVLAHALDTDFVAPETFAEERIILVILTGLALMISIVMAMFIYRRWPTRTGSRRNDHQKIYKILGPSLCLGIGAWAVLVAVPYHFETTLDGLRLFHPDLGWALTCLGGLCLFWAFLRPIWIWSFSP